VDVRPKKKASDFVGRVLVVVRTVYNIKLERGARVAAADALVLRFNGHCCGSPQYYSILPSYNHENYLYFSDQYIYIPNYEQRT